MKTDEMSTSPAPSGRVFPLSVEAYHALGEAGFLPENTELLYGVVFKKVSKSPFHVVLIARLMRLMGQAGSAYWVRNEGPIGCKDSEPEPDISIVRGTEDDYLRAHPSMAELVIEVCITSHDYDRSKLRAYATANVKECWLVLGPEKQIEVYWSPLNGEFSRKSIFGPGGELQSQALSEVRVELEPLFRE
jgi:Uma2 family endonuclease